jgi:cobalamin biosynthetic protein CobC
MDVRETMPEGPDELRYHGGNINLARVRFPDAPRPWIDLSTGINPLPWPIGEIAPSAWTRLPEPADVAALETTARIAYRAGPAAEIVAAPGTQSLIQWLARIVPARRVGVLGVTYGEHATCWRAAGAEVATIDTLTELSGFDAGVVVNPNNPDGRLLRPDALADAARALARRGGLLIVDEAFMDAFPIADSLVPGLPDEGAVVLRSFGKIYGLAGVRLGFAIAPPRLAASLRQAIGPWAVSGPAIEIGRRALKNTAWLAAAVARLRDDASRLDRLLQAAGFTIAGGTPLFRLTARDDAGAWFERLCQAGILTRPFLARTDWLRFGLPRSREEWTRLGAALGCPNAAGW